MASSLFGGNKSFTRSGKIMKIKNAFEVIDLKVFGRYSSA
jgi:hypothetical protein